MPYLILNLNKINQASDEREDSLRISIDTKAKVDLCDGNHPVVAHQDAVKALQADDHDMGIKPKLSPFGILQYDDKFAHDCFWCLI